MSSKANYPTLDEEEQIALSAQKKLNEAIAAHHVEILKLIQRLEKLGGSQDYSFTILEALKAYDGQLNLSFVSLVLPDHQELSRARSELVKKELITEEHLKNRKILKLVDQAE